MKKERFYEEGFVEFLQELLDSGRIDDGKEIGITKQVIDKGYDSLSDKQKWVFDKMIDANTYEECSRCLVSIPWCEMMYALDNEGLCSYCVHQLEKLDEE